MDRHVVAARVLDAPQVQDLGAGRRHLEHLLGGDAVELAGGRDDPRVGGEDAVDVGVDLADLGAQRGGQRDRGGVGGAAAQRGDVLGVLGDALEAGDDRDRAVADRVPRSGPGVMSMILALPCAESVITPACEPVNDCALWPSCGDRHREQRHRDPLAGGEQHVELARRRQRRHLLGEVAQLVGGVAHRRDDDDDVVAGLAGVDDALRDALDAGGISDGRAAVLLDDDAHDVESTESSSRQPVRHARRRTSPGVYRERATARHLEHLLGRGDVLVLAGELRVEPVVGDHREQRVERDAGQVAPGGDVGELPPPQRLVDVAGAVVAQPVLEVGGDAGQVVGELALDHLGHVGVEDVAVGVEVVEHRRPAAAASRRGRTRGRRRAGTPARLEVALGAEPGAGQRDLADLEQQQRDRAADVALPRDLAQREQEARERVRDLLGEVLASRWLHAVGRRSSCAPSSCKARPRVTSSAYSRSPPTGSPLASRVTVRSRSFNIRVR